MENYLTLELPYLEFDTNVIYDHNLYDKDGVYFVKDKAGIFQLVEVDKSGPFAGGNPLPASVCNMLVEAKVVDSLKEKLCLIDEDIDILRADMAEHKASLKDATQCMLEKQDKRLMEELKDIRDVLEGIRETIQEKPHTEDTPSKGYISEEALVEIIKNVRK